MLGNISFHNENRSDNTLPIKKRIRSKIRKKSHDNLTQMSQKGGGTTIGKTDNRFSSWFNSLSSNDKIYYMRIAIALFTAILNTVIGLVEITGVILAVFMLVVSHFVSVFILDIDPEDMGGHFKMFSIGIFSYLLIGLVTWVALYNIFVVPSLLAG
ncbi:MAG: hypothetical protein ACXACA_08295 [Candidatus Ranarchaeia archaeon]|jgi:hypothetical protein